MQPVQLSDLTTSGDANTGFYYARSMPRSRALFHTLVGQFNNASASTQDDQSLLWLVTCRGGSHLKNGHGV